MLARGCTFTPNSPSRMALKRRLRDQLKRATLAGRRANFSAPLNQDEFIIRDLILLLMSAWRHGLARRGKA